MTEPACAARTIDGAESPCSEPKSILAEVLFSKPRLPRRAPEVDALDDTLRLLADVEGGFTLRVLRFGVNDDQNVFLPSSDDLNLCASGLGRSGATSDLDDNGTYTLFPGAYSMLIGSEITEFS